MTNAPLDATDATNAAAATRTTETAVSGKYLPALDGVRALAIAGVFAWHLQTFNGGFRWASGGYLGVDLFFVLSGFLITSLLVEEWVTKGGIHLGRFWGHRARRLLPALLLMVVLTAAVLSYWSSGLPTNLAQFRGDALATIFYFANWHYLAAHQAYFDQFNLPSPLKHTWSLAIEEQFYAIWPLVIVALMWLTTRRTAAGPKGHRRNSWRRAGLVITVLGSLASAAWMAYLSHDGVSINRLYYGTDTRAFDLLVGAALSFLVVARPQPSRRGRRVLAIAAPLALLVLGICWVTAGTSTGNPTKWMWNGGFLLCAVAAAIVIADVRQVDPSPLGRALALRPLRYIGSISYGLYLWHWPVIVELNSARTGLDGLQLDAVQVATTLGAATVSYYLIERPFRRGWFTHWSSSLRYALAPVAMTTTAVVALVVAASPTATAAPKSVTQVTIPRTTTTVAAAAANKPAPQLNLGFTPTKQHPLRVMLVGDSVMLSDSPAVESLLDSTGVVTVVNHSEWGWGITHCGCTSGETWETQVGGWVRAVQPEIVIGMWSWDNGMASQHPDEYRHLLASFVRVVMGSGKDVRGVIFQQFPKPGPNLANPAADALAKSVASVDDWDQAAASMATSFPGQVMYVPIGYSILLDGQFTSWLPPENNPTAPKAQWVRVRMIDNVHLCPGGAARYAAALFSYIQPLFKLANPSATWWEGSWTTNWVAYEFPDYQNCPDDHP